MGRRRETPRPSAASAVTHRQQDLAELVGLGVGNPIRVAPGSLDAFREQNTLDEVARVDHRTALRTGTDERESPPPDRREELGLALGLKRPVEPRGPEDHRRKIAVFEGPLDQLLGFQLRTPVPHVRSEGRVLVEAIGARMVGAERRVRRDVHEARGAGAASAVEHELGPADVDVEQLADVTGGMDDRGRVDHGRAADVVEEPVDGGRIAHVADDDLDPRIEDLEERGVGRVVDETADPAPARLRDQLAHEVLAQPAGCAGDDDARGRRRGYARVSAWLLRRGRVRRRARPSTLLVTSTAHPPSRPCSRTPSGAVAPHAPNFPGCPEPCPSAGAMPLR